MLDETVARQNSGEWTWRNARRLAEVDRMLGGKALPARPPAGPGWRDCDGTMRQPVESEARAVPSAPATGSPLPSTPPTRPPRH
ncbi:hypothetical protein PIB19_14710 [Sphingomonas sp. 7/4-4]|uniref:hypothetical protein n=1 Tax=Sphingomonas sp. 7/4-4 TaxID=3018446 RepID=UPI0022F3E08A|nr:hypothetical protein [Sphingomonas sp. 7/4-4]WBY06769.1 hypothetical protein PIB19_14710 [Sphingomonas sp. 7/4-4]